MTAYVNEKTGVQVDIPDELAELIGGYKVVKSTPAPKPTQGDDADNEKTGTAKRGR